MAKVYMLYDYDEDGSERLVATLDRSRLPQMLEAGWGLSKLMMDDSKYVTSEARTKDTDRWTAYCAECSATLMALLAKPDDELADGGQHNLAVGWGGVCLRVVELE